MKLLLIFLAVLLTGCANHSLLIRCQQLEGQRDSCSNVLDQCTAENERIIKYLAECAVYWQQCEAKTQNILY
jgi:hypothetical protein